MKTPKIIKSISLATVLATSILAKAQIASIPSVVEPKQKILVDVRIKPSIQEFRAGLNVADSAENKFRLWVCNREERRCTISVSNESGFVWTSSFRDAYFNQVFNLSSLDDGEYLVKVDNGRDKFERKITLATNNYTRREIHIER